MAADEGPRPADQPLDDGDEQAGSAIARNRKPKPHGQRSRARAGVNARQPRRRERRDDEQQDAERHQEPAGVAEIGELVERLDEPAPAARLRERDRAGVDATASHATVDEPRAIAAPTASAR